MTHPRRPMPRAPLAAVLIFCVAAYVGLITAFVQLTIASVLTLAVSAMLALVSLAVMWAREHITVADNWAAKTQTTAAGQRRLGMINTFGRAAMWTLLGVLVALLLWKTSAESSGRSGYASTPDLLAVFNVMSVAVGCACGAAGYLGSRYFLADYPRAFAQIATTFLVLQAIHKVFVVHSYGLWQPTTLWPMLALGATVLSIVLVWASVYRRLPERFSASISASLIFAAVLGAVTCNYDNSVALGMFFAMAVLAAGMCVDVRLWRRQIDAFRTDTTIPAEEPNGDTDPLARNPNLTVSHPGASEVSSSEATPANPTMAEPKPTQQPPTSMRPWPRESRPWPVKSHTICAVVWVAISAFLLLSETSHHTTSHCTGYSCLSLRTIVIAAVLNLVIRPAIIVLTITHVLVAIRGECAELFVRSAAWAMLAPALALAVTYQSWSLTNQDDYFYLICGALAVVSLITAHVQRSRLSLWSAVPLLLASLSGFLLAAITQTVLNPLLYASIVAILAAGWAILELRRR